MKRFTNNIILIDKLIAIGVAALIGIITLIVVVWNSTENHYNKKLEEIVLEQQKTKHMMILSNIVRERLSTLTEMIFLTDPFAQYDAIDKFHILGERFIKEREKINFPSLSPEERLRWSQLRDLLTTGGRIQAEVVDEIERQNSEVAFNKLVNEAIPHQRKVIDTLSIMVDLQMERSVQAIGESIEAKKRRTYLIILFAILSVLTAGLLITLVIRKKKAEDLIASTNMRIRSLYEIATATSLSTEEQIIEALRSVCDSIGFDYAYITQVNYQDGICRLLYHTDQNMQPGKSIPLRQSLCSIAILSNEPTVILDIKNSSYNQHLAVANSKISAYIGNPVFVNGMKYGLINYVAERETYKKISKSDVECMTLASDWVVSILSKELLREQYLQSKAIEQATTIKNTVLNNINLDISTSIDSILGLVTEMDQLLNDSDFGSLRTTIGLSKKAGADLRSYVNNFIDMKNIQTDNIGFQAGLSDIHNIVTETVDTLSHRFKSSNNKVSTLIDDNLGAIELDEIRYRQILVNLIINANQHTSDGKVTVSVYRDSALGKNWLLTEVTDNGSGIESSRIPTLFIPFADSIDRDSNQLQQAQLGLSISDYLCRRMGGSISVESKLGYGSTFTIILPIYQHEKIAANQN